MVGPGRQSLLGSVSTIEVEVINREPLFPRQEEEVQRRIQRPKRANDEMSSRSLQTVGSSRDQVGNSALCVGRPRQNSSGTVTCVWGGHTSQKL